MAVLVTGGAGYIGSHVAWALVDRGETVVVLDDLSTGQREAVPPGVEFIEGDAGDEALVSKLIARCGVGDVTHLAGFVSVPRSFAEPDACRDSNVSTSAVLLNACRKQGVSRFVFASTASVYGRNDDGAIAETARLDPISPYGASKLEIEKRLEMMSAKGAFRFVALRCFNVAGADPEGRTGPWARDDDHLVTRACRAALDGSPRLEIFGSDYETPDGTCVRDYVHVADVARAYLAALDHLRGGGQSAIYNVGAGVGSSVRQVVDAVARASGAEIELIVSERRPGDQAVVVSDASRIARDLGWRPECGSLGSIIESAMAWERKRAADGPT